MTSSSRFKLETLPPQQRSDSDSPPSANKFSQFPLPTLSRLPSTSDLSTRSSFDYPAHPDASVVVAATLHPPDLSLNMDAVTPSGHRRRRSSLMNSIGSVEGPSSAAKKTRRPRRFSRRDTDGIQEEGKSPVDDLSGDDSRSTSEDVELDHLSDDSDIQDDEETGLTGKDKKKRKGRKRRNTLMDQRVAGEVKLTDEERREADHNVFKNSVINGVLIGLWYLFSLSISIYNKWMFSPDHLDFHFPLFTTCMHMLVQFSLSSLVLYFFPRFRPRYDSISNPNNTHVADSDRMRHDAEQKKPLMSRMFYFTRIGPCGMATGLDIGLGNMSLKFITLTFYTMCKSSSLAFVLIFAFLFRLESPSWRLVAIIATMTLGVVMMVAGEVDFKPLGFILVISAAFFSGFRWALTQILLLRNPATSNPFSSIFYLAPIMFTSLLIIAIPVEGFPDLFVGLQNLIAVKGPILGPAILLFPGILAFCMTSSEFALLQRTSVVTLSICGIFKEVVTISAAGIVFHDPLTPINVSGLFVTIGAIAAYNFIKIRKMREDARNEAHLLHAADHEGSDADDDTDYDRQEDAYVTSDGDLLPKVVDGKTKSPPHTLSGGESSGLLSGQESARKDLSD